jgi:hypothetical protein
VSGQRGLRWAYKARYFSLIAQGASRVPVTGRVVIIRTFRSRRAAATSAAAAAVLIVSTVAAPSHAPCSEPRIAHSRGRVLSTGVESPSPLVRPACEPSAGHRPGGDAAVAVPVTATDPARRPGP